jgi:hypothetical protein
MSSILIQQNTRTITRLSRVVASISSELEAPYLPETIRVALQDSMEHFQKRVVGVEAINVKLTSGTIVTETPVQA